MGSGVKNEDLIWLWKWPFLSICQIINVISWKWFNIEITCHQINFQAQKLVQTLITCSCTTTASSINPIISLFTPSKAYWITKLKNLKIWWMRRVMGWLSGLSFGPRNWSGDKLCQLWIIFRISASQLQIGLSYQGEGMGDPPKFSCPPPQNKIFKNPVLPPVSGKIFRGGGGSPCNRVLHGVSTAGGIFHLPLPHPRGGH